MSEAPTPSTWFLRTSPESVHGELTLDILRQWAEQGRLVAGNELSQDGEQWVVASDVPELKMDWLVTLKSGVVHGPFNLLSVPSIYRRGIIDDEAVLENKTSKQKIPATSLLRGLGSPSDDEGLSADESASTEPTVDPPPLVQESDATPSVGPARSGRSVSKDAPPPTSVSPLLGQRAPSGAADTSATPPASPLRPAVRPLPKVAKAAPSESLSMADTIRDLEKKAEQGNALRQNFETVSRENAALKARLGESGAPAPEGMSDERIPRRLKAEVQQLRQQMHISDVRAEAAESSYAEQTSALRVAQSEVTGLHQELARINAGADAQMGTSSDELRNAVDALTTLWQSSSRDTASRMVKSEALAQDLATAVHSGVEDLVALEAFAAELLANYQKLHESFAAERTQREGAEDMVQQERDDKAPVNQEVEISLRRRIALLESSLAERNNPKKSPAPPAVPADEKAIATKAEARIASVRTELQAVISTLRHENAKMASDLAQLQVPSDNTPGEAPANLDEVNRLHAEAVNQLDEAHASELATLKRELEDARRQQVATSALEGGDTVNSPSIESLKKENVVLMQRDAEQSESIAGLKSQVAGLYGEMATRQKEALDRFKLREVELKSDVDTLVSGMSKQGAAAPGKDVDHVKRLQADIAKLRQEKTTQEKFAMDLDAQGKALRDEIKALKSAQAEMGAKLVKSQKAQATTASKDSDLDASVQTFEVAQKEWRQREDTLIGEVNVLKKTLADGAREAATSEQQAFAKVDSERVETLKGELTDLREENKALKMAGATQAAPATHGTVRPRSMASWFLRLDNSKVFGPVSLTELIQWASDCRIGPEHQVSSDSKSWKTAAEVEELRMHWNVRLSDGQVFGPLNLFAVGQLIQDGVMGDNVTVTHVVTGEKHSFNTLIADEIKHLLGREKELVEALQLARAPEKRRKQTRKKS